jgi:phosphatidylglycerophosphate synthase
MGVAQRDPESQSEYQPRRVAWAQPPLIVDLLTVARVLLLGGLIWSILAGPEAAWVWVLAIVGADVLDGVLARKLGVDTKRRRSLDAVVDRVCIHASFAVAVAIRPGFVWIYLPLLIRDASALSASGVLLHRRGLLLLGGHWHKLASLSCAAFGIAILTASQTVASGIGYLAIGANYALLLDYFGGYLLARARDENDSLRIVQLAGIRFAVESAFGRRRAVTGPAAVRRGVVSLS